MIESPVEPTRVVSHWSAPPHPRYFLEKLNQPAGPTRAFKGPAGDGQHHESCFHLLCSYLKELQDLLLMSWSHTDHLQGSSESRDRSGHSQYYAVVIMLWLSSVLCCSDWCLISPESLLNEWKLFEQMERKKERNDRVKVRVKIMFSLQSAWLHHLPILPPHHPGTDVGK